MANADRLIVTCRNGSVDASNYQQLSFNVTTPAGSSADTVAQIAAYVAACGSAGIIAAGTSIADISLRSFGSAGATPVPWPDAEYDALVIVVSAEGHGMPALSDYDQGFGVGDLAPLGTSVSVSELTATVGRTGRGRHFLPYISENCVNVGGQFGNIVTNTELYNLLFFAVDGAGDPVAGIEVLPVAVVPASGVGTKPIIRVTPQPVFSNLESRRR